MAVFIQAPLLLLLALETYLVRVVFHGPTWLAIVLGFILLAGTWFVLMVYMATHPDWWPPWDEGLPRETRITNAYLPLIAIFIVYFVLVPVVQRARQNALREQQRHTVSTSINR